MAKSSAPQSSSRKFYILGLVSIALAILTHGYLTKSHMDLHYGHSAGESICDINATFSCAAAAASGFSALFGVPLALWGLATNMALMILALLAPISDEQNKAAARTNVLILAGFIAVVSVVMGVISLTQLSQYCPFCIATYVFSFLALLGLWKGLPRFHSGKPEIQIKPLAITGAVILVSSFLVNGIIKKQYTGGADLNPRIAQYVNDWIATPSAQIDVVAPLAKGSPESSAVMTIVEFADFRCSHCKSAAPVLNAFVKSHNDVRLIFQTWPLDGECNTQMQQSSGTSCLLARGFICAVQKEKGWEAHDWIFERQEQMLSPEAIRKGLDEMSSTLGLSSTDFKACLDSDETKKLVQGQAALGSKLNIRGTPTVFVNGRQLQGAQTLPVLQRAYQSIKSK